jgi:hypothetical protein
MYIFFSEGHYLGMTDHSGNVHLFSNYLNNARSMCIVIQQALIREFYFKFIDGFFYVIYIFLTGAEQEYQQLSNDEYRLDFW